MKLYHKPAYLLAVIAGLATFTLPATEPGRTSNSLRSQTFEAFTKPYREVEVSAAEGGRLSVVSIKRGQVVQQDQQLMALDSSVLEASRQIAKSKVDATARIEALRVEVDVAENKFQKLKALYESGAGNPEEVRRAEADAQIAKLNVSAAEEDRKLSELELKEIDARIAHRQIRSPIDGVVTDVKFEVGEYVSLNEPQVATVVDLSQLRASFFIPTAIALNLDSKLRVELLLPDTDQKAFGEIEHISAVTEADSGRVRVDVVLPNSGTKIRSGIRCRFVAK